MTEISKEPRRRGVLLPVVGVLAAIVAGAVLYGAFLYGTAALGGKTVSDCSPDSVKLADALKPLAKGDLAALRIEPHRPEPFAFERVGGDKLTLADFKGHAVLFNLWATWCEPCRVEMPALDRLEAGSGDSRFQVVAVNVDTARLKNRAAFLDSIGVKALTRYADPSGDVFGILRKDGEALGLPVTLVIDKRGCEIGSVEGGVKWDSVQAQALVGALKRG